MQATAATASLGPLASVPISQSCRHHSRRKACHRRCSRTARRCAVAKDSSSIATLIVVKNRTSIIARPIRCRRAAMRRSDPRSRLHRAYIAIQLGPDATKLPPVIVLPWPRCALSLPQPGLRSDDNEKILFSPIASIVRRRRPALAFGVDRIPPTRIFRIVSLGPQDGHLEAKVLT